MKFDVSGSLTKVVYEYDWSGKTVTHVAITDDHRYPSLNSSFPISIGVVWVGGDAAASEDHLTYAISNDGGETFTNHFMYNQVWPGRLGKASISMGANSDTGPGLVGVAFEKNLIGSVWVILRRRLIMPIRLTAIIPIREAQRCPGRLLLK